MDIEQEIIGHIILPFHFNNQLNLFLQDCVLVRQLRETEEYWTPGLVLSLPSAFALPPNLYKIKIYDPLPRQVKTKNMKNKRKRKIFLLDLCTSKRYD